jgi:hypothetical protein
VNKYAGDVEGPMVKTFLYFFQSQRVLGPLGSMVQRKLRTLERPILVCFSENK